MSEKQQAAERPVSVQEARDAIKAKAARDARELPERAKRALERDEEKRA